MLETSLKHTVSSRSAWVMVRNRLKKKQEANKQTKKEARTYIKAKTLENIKQHTVHDVTLKLKN